MFGATESPIAAAVPRLRKVRLEISLVMVDALLIMIMKRLCRIIFKYRNIMGKGQKKSLEFIGGWNQAGAPVKVLRT